jgi:hypothetical protein
VSWGAFGTTSMPVAAAIRWYSKPGRVSSVPTSSPASFFLVNIQLIVRCCRRTRVERVAGQRENMCAATKCSGGLSPCGLSSLTPHSHLGRCVSSASLIRTLARSSNRRGDDNFHRQHGHLTHPAIYCAARSSIDVSEPRQWRRGGSKNNSKDSLSHPHYLRTASPLDRWDGFLSLCEWKIEVREMGPASNSNCK